MPRTLNSARRNYGLSALIARRAVREARQVRGQGTAAVAGVVVAHQIANARTSDLAVAEMLAEQEIDSAAEAILDMLGFTTGTPDLAQMLEQVQSDWQFDRLVESLVQDAARAAESVSVTARRNVFHVRFVNPPCCARCAILAGRIYRWSSGFQRHPGCDCSMIPTTVASTLRTLPSELVRDGQVSGLSKADMKALEDGADLNQIVNVRRTQWSSLMEAGQTLRRGHRLTPAGIYRRAGDDREEALRLLGLNGFIR